MNLPKHVAIIMDGNGRWAKQHAVSVGMGHHKGVETLREIIRYSSDNGIKVLSLYAFSTENWKRSKTEVDTLMRLVLEYFESEIDELNAKAVKIRILGDKEALPFKQREAVIKAEEITSHNEGMQLNIALNYGAKEELTRAVIKLAKKAQQCLINPDNLQYEDIAAELYTEGQPEVDLLIRTSGEMRLSNFLLLQSAYAEFVFPQQLWPEFTVADYQEALNHFGKRERRFGGRIS